MKFVRRNVQMVDDQSSVHSTSPKNFHQSEKPTIFPSQLHQIISSSSSSSWSSSPHSPSPSPSCRPPPALSSPSTRISDPRHRTQTPSIRPPFRFPFICLFLPPSTPDPNPESAKKSARTLSIAPPQFCFGVQAGCTNRRG